MTLDEKEIGVRLLVNKPSFQTCKGDGGYHDFQSLETRAKSLRLKGRRKGSLLLIARFACAVKVFVLEKSE